MKLTSYWTDDFPRPTNLPVSPDLPTKTDVVVIGAGYTGLSAARTLAKSGTNVVVLERETIGWGASSRNAGITGSGLKAGMQIIFKRYGEEYGYKFWQASLEMLDLIKELEIEEGIDFDWHQNGELGLAYKASHIEGMKARVKWYQDKLGDDIAFVPASDISTGIGSNIFHGGVFDKHGAGLHPAKLVFGLAEVAARNGALLCEEAGVFEIEKETNGFILHTAKGVLKAKEIIVATNGYTDLLVPKLKQKVIPVGSYSIVTEPLSKELQNEISPKDYVLWDSKWFLNYFRLTPDGRMLWGGRNNLSTTLDLKQSAENLRGQMLRAFPQLENVPITHSWTGQLGLTFDLMPNIGCEDGFHYAFGYGGHGLHTAIYLGREIALLITGKKSSSPFMEIPHRNYFFYRNKPWFLPLVVSYYQIKDWIS
ncbi:MAG: NAD(P)/FAD-dependent oxidoreductase [Anaerolineales bacterium]|jgi:glycine/D-amino acid oxidase-like deaminating enzyme